MTKPKAWEHVLVGLAQDRTTKPRQSGLTMVLDRCHGLTETKDLIELSGDYIDHIKLSFGTTVFLDEDVLRRKIAMIREAGIEVYPGGTLFEVAVFEGVCAAYLQRARALGFTAVEVSDGTIDLPSHVRADAIRRALDLGLKVFTEVGKKDPAQQPSPAELNEQIHRDLELGAEKVIVEARESGTNVGIYDAEGRVVEDRLDALLAGLDSVDRIIWEAPLKQQQDYLVLRFGPNVNLGNIRPQDVLALESVRCGLRWETFRLYVAQLEH